MILAFHKSFILIELALCLIFAIAIYKSGVELDSINTYLFSKTITIIAFWFFVLYSFTYSFKTIYLCVYKRNHYLIILFHAIISCSSVYIALHLNIYLIVNFLIFQLIFFYFLTIKNFNL